jgi:hypothetical protein
MNITGKYRWGATVLVEYRSECFVNCIINPFRYLNPASWRGLDIFLDFGLPTLTWSFEGGPFPWLWSWRRRPRWRWRCCCLNGCLAALANRRWSSEIGTLWRRAGRRVRLVRFAVFWKSSQAVNRCVQTVDRASCTVSAGMESWPISHPNLFCTQPLQILKTEEGCFVPDFDEIVESGLNCRRVRVNQL